ncbi:lipid A core--O-antigen ligase [Grimontia sp. AD028]|uniref:lipid A core--O-antigen ligase n=1 Tax=Grimontia sp. AD028 TaxID=1581149 RepID=UPI00061AE936|nr:lipid A core--O-antigen ligase [Grimontia sp. AD028]KKD58282.1 lipid A core--O-antigen ligase [Grimontia sp. AD028]
MQTMRFQNLWPSKVARKPLVKPVLIALAALFLFCLPLNQIPLAFSGVQHPATALTLLLAVAIVCFGVWEAARQGRFSHTTMTGWLTLCASFALIPSFYLHADWHSAAWQGFSVLLSLLLFCTLQQFSFNHLQRQYLLWLPLLSGWLLAIPLLLPSISEISSSSLADIKTNSDVLGIVLLTSLMLSAYLLARTKVYKRNWVPVHALLLATPLLTIPALTALKSPWLITVILVLVIFSQPFLFRFSPKRHHGLWNFAVLAGFAIAWKLGSVPQSALFAARYSSEELEVLSQAWALLGQAQFEGIGLGQLDKAQLLFGIEQNHVLPLQQMYPSWLLANLIQGGIAYWASFGVLFTLVVRKLMEAPNGTRLMLLAIFLPSLIGMAVTDYIETNLALGMLFVVLLYWIDNLTARYRRVLLSYPRPMKVAANTVLTTTLVLVLSSIYLGEQALRTYQIRDSKLTQYQTHPWWNDFYQQVEGKRAFLESVESRDLRAQELYLRGQISRLETSPNADGYQSLIELAMLTGHKTVAKQLKDEASLLFPYRTFQPDFSELPAE